MTAKRRDIEPKPTVWHAELIKAAIRMRGATLTKLAIDNDLDGSAVRAALIRPQPKADKVISRFLGIPLCELWPDRYDESGHRICHVRDDDSADHAPPHCLSAGAR